MAYATPTTRAAGYVVPYTVWNSDVVDNVIALRTGAIAIASQAAGDVVYAASATQLGRLAAGTTSQVLIGGASAPAWSNTPTLTGTNITGIPAASILAGTFGSGNYTITGTLAWGGGSAISSSSNVALLNAANTFTTSQQLTSEANAYIGFADTTNGVAGYIGPSEQIIAGGNVDSLGLYGVSGIDFSPNTGASVLMTLSSAGLLTVSGFGTHDFTGGAGSNGENLLQVSNANTSTAASAALGSIAGTTQGYFTAFSQGHSTLADTVRVYTTKHFLLQTGALGDVTLQSRGATALTLGASQAATFAGAVSAPSFASSASGSIFLTDFKVLGQSTGAATFYLWADVGSGSADKASLSIADDAAAMIVNVSEANMFQFAATASTSSASLLGRSLGTGSVTGPYIHVGRNQSGSGAAGGFGYTTLSGTSYYTWTDSAGDLRISTALPQEDGSPSDTSGTVVGTQTSTLASKTLTGKTLLPDVALSTILDTKVESFTYKSGAYNNTEFFGIIADYSPEFAMDQGRSFNPVSAFGYTVQAIKAMAAKIASLESKLAQTGAA